MVSCIISKVIKGNYLTFLKIECCAYAYNLLHHFLKVIMTFKWSSWCIYIYVGTSFPFLCFFFFSLKKKKRNLRSLIILQSLLKVDKLLLLLMPTISVIAVTLQEKRAVAAGLLRQVRKLQLYVTYCSAFLARRYT